MSAPSPQSHLSLTPILDRLEPLPPPRGASLIEIWIGLALSTAPAVLMWWKPRFFMDFLYWCGRNIKLVMANPDWAGVSVILIGFAIAMVCSAAILIHECGHLLAGLALGFRCDSFRFGRFKIDRGFKVSRYQDSEDAASGWAAMVPVRWNNLRPRAAMMILAGPLASLLSAYMMLKLRSDQSLISGSFIAVSVYFGLGSLLPFNIHGHVADGRRLSMLLFDRKRSERYIAMLKLVDEIERGVPAAALDPVELEHATRFRDDSIETARAYTIAYLAAFHRKDDAEASQLLETALKYSGHAPAALRDVLAVQAALFQATRRDRLDLAQQWLMQAPAGISFVEERKLLEQAIARGKECAFGHDLEKTSNTVPDPPILL